MADDKLQILCTHCGHPYLMSRLQASVFNGRNMGCMACGRPFTVRIPEPEPEPEPEEVVAGQNEDATGPAESDVASTPDSAVVAKQATAPDRSAGADTGNTDSPARTSLAWLGVAGTWIGVSAMMLAAVAALLAYSTATAGAAAYERLSPAASALLGYVVPGLALVAFLLGIAGIVRRVRMKSRDLADDFSGGPAIGATILGMSELVVIALLMLLVHRRVAAGMQDNAMAIDMGQLQQIGNALAVHAARDPANRLPDSLDKLVTNSLVSSHETLTEPSEGKPYHYVGKGHVLPPGKPSSVVVIYEKPGKWPDGGALILFADSTLRYAKRAQAEQIAREIEAGQNPPPAAGALRGQ